MRTNERARLPALRMSTLVFFCIIGVPSTSWALDMPKRKPGLWEIRTNMPGIPGDRGPIQHCIDEKTDNLMQQQASKHEVNCPVKDVRRDGDRIVVHSVCKMNETTMTSDAVFTGRFDSAYQGDIKVRYEPPLHGRSDARITQEAKWVGPCKPGQKPGDIVMPGMGTINPTDPSKNVQLQEMMKRMQEQRSGGK